tara:strand:+ start:355 stop:675 length:321 start_codon:yes stop_codon:yes gene_type:complete
MHDARITLHPSKQRMQVQANGILLADSTNTLELREHGYLPCRDFPRENVRIDLLTVSETTTYCPFKGHTIYFSFGESQDVAWSNGEPNEEIEALAGRLAFYEEVSA